MPERLGIVPTAADLLDAPERALDLPHSEAMSMLARVGALEATLRARLAARSESRNDEQAAHEGLLSVDEAARRAGVSHEQFLRRKAFRPAIVRQGHRTLRVSAMRLERIIAQMVA